jgi:DNA-binding response OmpR family regulator
LPRPGGGRTWHQPASDILSHPVTSALECSYLGSVLEVQDIRIDPETRRAWRGVEEIVLSRKEFDLVWALISRAGDIVTREELMRDVWHTTFWTSSKTIDVHLGWVRRKLGDDSRHPHLITTIRGKGLRFETEAPAVRV